MKQVLVTGGAGFIGSAFIRRLLSSGGEYSIINLDSLTYAGDLDRLDDVSGSEWYSFIKGDICDPGIIDEAFACGVDILVHFAAESHVDRSITDALPFERTNVRGTLTLLEAARKRGVGRFVHVSTDEIYGELGQDGSFTEVSPFRPNSPYSVSKAAADMMVSAYHHTYGLPTVIVRPSNNYGPWQYPEKLIPVVISRAMEDKPVPVYAHGENVREWLFVDDCAKGIITVMEQGREGEAYNLGSGQERRNIDVVRKILALMNKPESLIEYVTDRPGHDFRYSLDSTKISGDLGYSATTPFEEGLELTVEWYVANRPWLNKYLL